MKIIPLALLQETSDIQCDTGSPVYVLKKEFSGRGSLTGPELGGLIEGAKHQVERIDWEVLDPVFPKKQGIYTAEKGALEERARLAREWLWQRDEEHVVAVLHGGVGSPIIFMFEIHHNDANQSTLYYSSFTT